MSLKKIFIVVAMTYVLFLCCCKGSSKLDETYSESTFTLDINELIRNDEIPLRLKSYLEHFPLDTSFRYVGKTYRQIVADEEELLEAINAESERRKHATKKLLDSASTLVFIRINNLTTMQISKDGKEGVIAFHYSIFNKTSKQMISVRFHFTATQSTGYRTGKVYQIFNSDFKLGPNQILKSKVVRSYNYLGDDVLLPALALNNLERLNFDIIVDEIFYSDGSSSIFDYENL